MYELGIDNQLYFCLEDFQSNKEGVVRNVGIFSFDSTKGEYRGEPKSIYNIFKMLAKLGSNMFSYKINDKFVGIIATKSGDYIAILVFNYIDPDIARNYLSKNIVGLKKAERNDLLEAISFDKLDRILQRQLDIPTLGVSDRIKNILKSARELNDLAKKAASAERRIKLGIKNLKGNYLYQKFIIDSACSSNCGFAPFEEKEVETSGFFEEAISLKPYSVQLITFQSKPKELEAVSNKSESVNKSDVKAEEKR
jgi:hypothetical protein